MSEEKDNFAFATARYPEYAAAIDRMREHPDFQELCEHFVWMCRLENEKTIDGNRQRFTELRQSLEEELLDWLRRDQNS